MGWSLLRAPALPVEAYPSRRPATGELQTIDALDERVLAALAVGTESLSAALQRKPRSPRSASRVRLNLLRYLIRMSTRPTPYGLFAGVGLIEWGSTTTVSIAAGPPRTRARPDMGWLLDLVLELERDPHVRRRLRLFPNPLALATPGWAFVDDHTNGARARVRGTAALLRVLRAGAAPRAPEEIARDLANGGTCSDEIESRVDRLYQHGFLLSDLRPPLTIPDPARYVYERLAPIPAARDSRNGLAAFLQDLGRWDVLPIEERADAWTRISERARKLRPGNRSASIAQVDMALPLAGSHAQVELATEAATAAELLLRLSPHPNGPPDLQAYRERFEERYGAAREVPLLELLDVDFGLGPPQQDSSALQESGARRDETMLQLAIRALHERRRVVELDDALLSELQTWTPLADEVPPTVEICVAIAASSVTAIDRGEFMVVVLPNVGAQPAGRHLARFVDLLGPVADEALQRVIQREHAGAQRLLAEVVYLPRQMRAANIAVRPPVALHEIVAGTSPGVPWNRAIPISELLVGLKDGRFHVRWPAGGVDIAASEFHMLNPQGQASPAIRFLCDVEQQDRVQLMPFDWGPAVTFPFLPRIQYGRVVLSPAQWGVNELRELRVAKRPSRDVLSEWRTRWRVPRHVYLTEGDNRLLLDLDDRAHVEVLFDDLRREPRRHTILQEALPGPAEAWLPGPDGRHMVELVVPLAARVQPGQRRQHITATAVTAPAASSSRLRVPGSDWLFVKLYSPAVLEEHIISRDLLDLVAFAESANLVSGWFYVRYADPRRHLRLRLRGAPDDLLRLMPHVCRWAAKLVSEGSCFSFAFDTYERELERYGGEIGMHLSEQVFAADSRAVAELLDLRHHLPSLDRIAMAVLTVDRLLEGLRLGDADRLHWYRTWAPLSSADGEEYRRRQHLLRPLLAHGHLADHRGSALASVLTTRRHTLRRVALDLETVVGSDRERKTTLYRDFVHMHCNRLLGGDPASEQLVIQLARRAHESLSCAQAPLSSAKGLDSEPNS